MDQQRFRIYKTAFLVSIGFCPFVIWICRYPIFIYRPFAGPTRRAVYTYCSFSTGPYGRIIIPGHHPREVRKGIRTKQGLDLFRDIVRIGTYCARFDGKPMVRPRPRYWEYDRLADPANYCTLDLWDHIYEE